MNYVVATQDGKIVKGDLSRQSEAINWARSEAGDGANVSKVPEVIRVAGSDQIYLVTDAETAKQQGWAMQ